MRVVKALVAFMGVLIVVGIGLVVYGLSLDKNAESPENLTTPASPSVPVSGSQAISANGDDVLAEFGDIVIDLETDEQLAGYTLHGDQASLHIKRANGNSARLIIVSLGEKKVLGRIILKSAVQ